MPTDHRKDGKQQRVQLVKTTGPGELRWSNETGQEKSGQSEVRIKEKLVKALARRWLKRTGRIERMGEERLTNKPDAQRVEGRRR